MIVHYTITFHGGGESAYSLVMDRITKQKSKARKSKPRKTRKGHNARNSRTLVGANKST